MDNKRTLYLTMNAVVDALLEIEIYFVPDI